MKLYHKTFILPLVLLAFSACATQFANKLTVSECIHACSPLVPYGFRPMWSKDGVCACLAPSVPQERRHPKNHINSFEVR